MSSAIPFFDAARTPSAVWVNRRAGEPFERLHAEGGKGFAAQGVTLSVVAGSLDLTATTPVTRLALRWDGRVAHHTLIWGDAFERSYGDLGWGSLRAERALHWYGAAHDPVTAATTAFGVRTGAAALCHWTLDSRGLTLWLDVRAGNAPLDARGRTIHLADVVAVQGRGTAWDAVGDLVTAMAPPRLRGSGPMIGANNWYYAYGRDFGEDAVLRDAATIVEYAEGTGVRPYAVIDDGWNPGGEASGGPWDHGSPGVFDDMPGLAARITAAGARPGIWFRPLRSRIPVPGASRPVSARDHILDPGRDETLELVAADLRRFREWGFELVKHDFSTFDVLGDYGPRLGADLGGQPLGDGTRTTAEVLVGLYETIADAAGDMALIGCNTVGHLAAGRVDAQRIGDDTSGRDWERTRRMGVNSLAHRLAQHGRFFIADADCVAVTPETPWSRNRQFLDLIARSGSALFVSVDPRARSGEVDDDIRAALALTVERAPGADIAPLDWELSSTPDRWRDGDDEIRFDWEGELGAAPYRV